MTPGGDVEGHESGPGDYCVRLSAFHGPLDLLLYLVRRAEVDLHDIPISTIADQYVDFLRHVEHVDIDSASEFLVMASKLIALKARTLAPQVKRGDAAGEAGARDEEAPDGSDGSDGSAGLDPRHELVQALIAYQRHRRSAELLERHRQQFWQRHSVRLAAAPRVDAVEAVDESEEVEAIELDDAHLGDLVSAYARIAAAVDFSRLGDHCVEYDDTPIELHAADLIDRLVSSARHRISLWSAFEGRSRIEMIGLFLATLELARQRKVRIEQDDPFGEVELVLETDPVDESGSVDGADGAATDATDRPSAEATDA